MFPLQQIIRIKYFDQYFAKTIKNRSRRILRLWTDHCEYIIAQRFRRGQQMLCLYRRIWDEQALRGIVQQIQKQVLDKIEKCFSTRYYSESMYLCKLFLRNGTEHN